MTRKQANEILLLLLENYLKQYPDIRFGQALVNLNMLPTTGLNQYADPFYEESAVTLKRVQLSRYEND